MAFRKHLSGQKGFTLIELLVVVAILGILATVAVPRVMGAIDNARERKASADLTSIRNALERFYLEYGVFPTNLGELTADFDANFDFTNSYGNVYFYAVYWEGTGAVPTGDTLKDYILADPGQSPPADVAAWVAGGYTGAKSAEGQAVATAGFFWGTDPTPATSITAQYPAVGIDGTAHPMTAELDFLDAAKPTGTWVVYTGQ